MPVGFDPAAAQFLALALAPCGPAPRGGYQQRRADQAIGNQFAVHVRPRSSYPIRRHNKTRWRIAPPLTAGKAVRQWTGTLG